MSDFVIFHNPKCSKSRQTLQLLRDKGVEPEIREYLVTPPSESELSSVAKKLGLRPKDFIRKKEESFRQLDIDIEDDGALLSAIVAHPKILERPIVVRGDRAVLGRPPENIEDLF